MSSRQQCLVGIKYDLPCTDWSSQMELRFGSFRENSAQKHGPATCHRIQRNRRHQVLGSILLQDGAADRHGGTLVRILDTLQSKAWDIDSINPSGVKPIQGFLLLKPEGGRQFFFEHLEQIAGRNGLSLISLSYLAQRANKRLLGVLRG